jgi:DNA-binding IclR family transcriptional regulator
VTLSKDPYQVPAVVRAIEILEFIGQNGEKSFTEIYTHLNFPKSSTHQILQTLRSLGYVRQSGESPNFALGLKLLELGSRTAEQLDIRKEALPILKELSIQTNLTCHLGILDGTAAVYLAKVESLQPVRLNSWEGKRSNLHSSALGKILTAWLEEEDVDDILSQIKFTPNTPNTITDPKGFKRHLQLVRKQGWSLDNEENEPMVQCIGAPVWNIKGEVCAAISASGLARQSAKQIQKLAKTVILAANDLTNRIGGI